MKTAMVVLLSATLVGHAGAGFAEAGGKAGGGKGVGAKIANFGNKARKVGDKAVDKTAKGLKYVGKKTAEGLDTAGNATAKVLKKATD